FQQVSKPDFVDAFRVKGLGYGGDVFYQPQFIDPDTAVKWYNDLLDLDTYQPMLKMYGKTFPQSRSIAAYSTTPGAKLKYSGSEIEMHHPFPPILESMRQLLQDQLGVNFNHVMLNRYDDGSVYIGRHSDNLNNLVIASVSLGAERTFILSPRLPAKNGREEDEETMAALQDRENVKWTLENGSLVVMQGRTQEFWKHEIPKQASVKTGRISLTFRQLV
ncbi:hypothetical protein DB88DRAFT_433098, partial [Papiliotrema laurentii]